MPRINPYMEGPTANPNLGKSNLGKDDFLKLLITQLNYQNPLEPMDNRELVAQMAQFSSLEQMQNLNQQMASMSAVNAIGRTVKAVGPNQQEITGTVVAVAFDKGHAHLKVAIEDAETPEIKVPIESVYQIC